MRSTPTVGLRPIPLILFQTPPLRRNCASALLHGRPKLFAATPRCILAAVIPLTDTFVHLMTLLTIILMFLVNIVLAMSLFAVGRELFGQARRKPMTEWSVQDIDLLRASIVAGTSLALLIFLFWMLPRIPDLENPIARILYGTFLTTLLSAILFKCKLSALRWYAVIEAVFALLVCISTLHLMKDNIAIKLEVSLRRRTF